MSKQNKANQLGKPSSTPPMPRVAPRSRHAPVDVSSPPIRRLLDMHRLGRPHGGEYDGIWCGLHLDKLPGMVIDAKGNRILRVGENPTVLWSSHTDTVHREDTVQAIAFGDNILTLSDQEAHANCLGADCTAGAWLMREMVLRGKEGLYIWHAGEECGGIGSSHIAKKTPELLAGITHAVAFDRRGVNSVITHQFGGRTASEGFAQHLAEEIGGEYAPDPGGTFTDTANYAGLVAECTNISVGYHFAHSRDEALDVGHLAWLLERLMECDPISWPVIRDPKLVERKSCGLYDYGAYDHLDWGMPAGGRTSKYPASGYGRPGAVYSGPAPGYYSSRSNNVSRLERLIRKHPDVAAAMLDDMGVSPEDFEIEAGML